MSLRCSVIAGPAAHFELVTRCELPANACSDPFRKASQQSLNGTTYWICMPLQVAYSLSVSRTSRSWCHASYRPQFSPVTPGPCTKGLCSEVERSRDEQDLRTGIIICMKLKMKCGDEVEVERGQQEGEREDELISKATSPVKSYVTSGQV